MARERLDIARGRTRNGSDALVRRPAFIVHQTEQLRVYDLAHALAPKYRREVRLYGAEEAAEEHGEGVDR